MSLLGGRRVKLVTKPIFPVQKAAANLAASFERNLPRFHEMDGLGKATGPVAIIGGGPSLNTQFDKLREFPGPRIVCGSAHDHLVANGIVCEYCVFLDPHEVMATFLTRPQKGTTYLIASSCDPSVFDILKDHRVLIWHPAMLDPETGKNAIDVRGEPVIEGGDGVVLRAWPIAAVMGYRDFHFYGFDCSFPIDCRGQHAYDYKFVDEGNEQPIGVRVEHTGERFISCPGWIMQLQEFCKMLSLMRNKFDITIHGDSLAASTLCKGTTPHAPEKFAEGVGALLRGDLLEGFAGMEYRQGLRGAHNIPLPGGKEWKGEDLRGKTLFLHGEQGHGDMIQVMRYIPVLVQCGADVVMAVHPVQRRLFERVAGVRVLGEDEPWPPYDYWLGMMSLPHRFGTTLESILPPFTVDLDKNIMGEFIEAIRALSDDDTAIKVGVCWHGSLHGEHAEVKSTAADDLRPLSAIGGATLFSLQVPGHGRDGVGIDLAPCISDLWDMAHAIANMDLVVTVDTVVAHLAGTIGVPTWTMLTNKPVHWPWMLDREDSPWYPSVRLFRQREDETGWGGVVRRISNALLAKVGAETGRRTMMRIDNHLGFSMDLDMGCAHNRKVAEIIHGGGIYEPEVVDLMRRVIRRNDFFVDVGANAGYFTLLAASLGAHVLAIEPAPAMAGLLRENVCLNGYSDMVRVVEAAMWDSDGAKGLYLRAGNSGGAALWRDRESDRNIPVETMRIDELVAWSCHVRMMKVDAEGAERHIFAGMGSLRPDYITCELYEKALGEMGSTQMGLRNVMKMRGYDTFTMSFDGEPPKMTTEKIEPKTIMNILFSTQDSVDAAWSMVQIEAAE